MLYETFDWKQDDPPPPKAQYRRSRVGETPRSHRWNYIFFGPKGLPYFASDERLRMLCRAYPEFIFLKCERMHDRDFFTVELPSKNFFNRSADEEARKERDFFLRSIGSLARKEHDIPEHVQRACKGFMRSHGFCLLIWMQVVNKKNGRQRGSFKFKNTSGDWVDSYRVNDMSAQFAVKHIAHLCAPYPDFRLEAAQQ